MIPFTLNVSLSKATYSHSYIHADQHSSSSLGFSVLPMDRGKEESIQQPSDSKTLSHRVKLVQTMLDQRLSTKHVA